YADNHEGVCLCLNRDVLLSKAEDGLAAKGAFAHGRVIYRNDRGIDRSLLHADLSDVRELGVAEWVHRHLWQHREEFFFRKLGDWASEMEYRLLLHVDHREPEYVDISEALEAVICGYAVAEDDLAQIRALCEPDGVEVRRVGWSHALP